MRISDWSSDVCSSDLSVRPILDAGLAELIDPPFQLTDELMIEAAPGHSPGHCILVLRSGGVTAIFPADTMHPPVQIYDTQLNSRFRADPTLALQSRQAVHEQVSLPKGTHIPAHFW